MKRLIDRRNIPGVDERTSGDTLKDRKAKLSNKKYDYDLLAEAHQAWDNLQKLRATRARNFRYCYGDQLGDMVQDENGDWVTERERISKRTGGIPLQNNHLITIPTTLSGVYTKSMTVPTCYARTPNADDKADMMTNALQANWKRTLEREVMGAQFVEMCVGGTAFVSEEWTTVDDQEDSYTTEVNPDYGFFKKSGNDARGWDIYMIGEIRDYTLNALAARFAATKEDYDELKEVYRKEKERFSRSNTYKADSYETISWEKPSNAELCRTYHIWTQETRHRYRIVDMENAEHPVSRIEDEDLVLVGKINAMRAEENAQRTALALQENIPEGNYELLDMIEVVPEKGIWDTYWHCTVMAPNGLIIDEFDSPYEHKSHPYILRMFNYVRGEIVPFISPVIDQQRYINRLVTLFDLSINSSIKGLKMVPKDCIPSGMTEDQFAKNAIELGGWIFYEPSDSGAKPEVITQSALTVGISDILSMQVNWVKDISNVSGALQGQAPAGGTAFSRYALETENSTTSLASLMEKFKNFEVEVARKKMKVIHQYYTEPRNISNQHTTYAQYSMYDPVAVADIDFDINIEQSADTPTARAAVNELMQLLWEKGAVSVLDMLNGVNLPGKESMINAVKASQQAQQQQYEQAQANGQQMGAMQPYFTADQEDKIAQQAHPETQQAMQRALERAGLE